MRKALLQYLCTFTAIALGAVTWQAIVHFGDTSRLGEPALQAIGISIGAVVAFTLSLVLGSVTTPSEPHE